MESNTMKSENMTREAILKLLSDDEVARVSTMEAGPPLPIGAEYVDLEHPNMGVRRAQGEASLRMSDVLPRSAVLDATWSKICKRIVR